jgi:sugar/nucleoside kinase (ribokinase family)
MNVTKEYDVICIGNYTKDTIISPAGMQYVDGGAVNYAAHAAVRLGLKVAVVTRLAEEDQRVIHKFNSDGIDTFVTYTQHSTLMKLEYPTTNPDIRTLTVSATAGPITARDIQDIHTRAAVIGTSFRGEVGLDVIKALKAKNILVAADMQGFVRVLREGALNYEPWDDMQSTLAEVDIVKSDAVEAEYLTGESDIHKAAEIFASMGPKEIVLTHKDGVLFLADGRFSEVGFYPVQLNGRSGRGDTCLGAYTAMRLLKPPHQAGIWAAAVTSLKMEKHKPFDRSIKEVESLLAEKYGIHTHL